MIIPLPLIVSLLLAIIQATDFPYEIKLETCSLYTDCYIRKSCITQYRGETNAENVLFLFTETKDNLEGETCDVVVQVKAIVAEKYLVLMQVTNGASAFIGADGTKGISIMQNNLKQMGCNADDADPSGTSAKLKFQFKGKGSKVFEKDRMFCSFIVTSTEETISDLFKDPTLQHAKPSFDYELNGGKVQLLYFGKGGDQFWKKKREPCTPELISKDISNDDIEQTEADTSKVPVTCPAGKLWIKHNDVETEVDKLDCNTASEEWSWGTPAIIPVQGKDLEIACNRVKYCKLCTDLPEACDEKNDCTKPEPSEENGCPVLTCPKDSYTIDGKENKQSKPVKCKKSGPNAGEWHFDDEASGGEAIKQLSCRSINHCTADGLNFKCPESRGHDCKPNPTIAEDKLSLSCAGGGILYNGEGQAPEITCDTKDGKWSGITGDQQLYCAEKKAAPQKEEEASTGNTGLIVGAVVGSLVLLGGIGAAVYIFVIKPKQDKKKAPPSKGLSSKKSKYGKSMESRSKKGSSSDPPPTGESSKGKEGAPATPADTTPAAGATPADGKTPADAKPPASDSADKKADVAPLPV